MTRNILFTPGAKFESLTVIECLNKTDHRRRILWLFKCECGKQIEVSASDIQQKRKTHCGCKIKEIWNNAGKIISQKNTKPNKQGPINKLYGQYQRAAAKRGYEWKLSKSEFIHFLTQNCYYCGASPSNEYSNSKHRTTENTLVYNGIDRMENTIGYNLNNCISACYKCNKMKMELNKQDFLDHIKKIYNKLLFHEK